MQPAQPSKPRSVSVGALALSIVLMAAEWVLLVGGLRRDEMIVGGLSVVAGGIFFWHTLRVSSERIQVRARDVAQGWRLPGMMIQDAWVVTAVLLRDLFRLEPAGSIYRVIGYQSSLHDPRLIGRRVLATVYTTCTPNSIVIGTDVSKSRMLVHQLKRAPTPKLLRNLGAQS